METKQLELFSENDFEPQKVYLWKTKHWVIIDNLDRSNFETTRKIHYKMIIDTIGGIVYDENSIETTPLRDDKKAGKLNISEYFMLACLLKEKGIYLYNKKLGKPILKNR
jgi:hypothetical protein